MANQSALDYLYMDIAWRNAELSNAVRAKVGACLVTPSGVLLTGWNGTPPGYSNVCEYQNEDGQLITKPEVIHAELNCILKAAKQGVSCVGGTMYITLSPCQQCAGMMVSCGIVRVVYSREYRDLTGVDALITQGIKVDYV